MPIEIRELVIRATITEENTAGSQGQSGDANGSSPNQELINLCVEKVIEILKEKNGR
jgi:hypothetical protein